MQFEGCLSSSFHPSIDSKMEIGYRGTKHGQTLVRLLQVSYFTKYVTHRQGDKVETGDQAENYNCEH